MANPQTATNPHRAAQSYLRSYSELMEKVAGTGLVPPQCLEVEQSVLGAMMIDRLAASRVMEVIGEIGFESSPFYRESHTVIYRAITALNTKSITIDLLSVTERIRFDDEMETVGGPAYLVELTSKVVTTANVEAHSRLILEKHFARQLIRVCEEIKLKAFLGQEDVFELTDQAEQLIFEITAIRTRKGIATISQVNHNSLERLDKIHKQDSYITGIPADLDGVDDLTTGWQDSNLIIVAARPSQGKTALGLTFARNAALHEHNGKKTAVAIFSLEMSADELGMRLLCAEAKVDSQDARKGKLSADDFKKISKAITRLDEAKIFIDDTAAITPLELRAKCRRLKATENIGLVIVDYLQLMEVSRHMDSREREISTISRSLKALAKELRIPVIALSQLNRGLESRTGFNRRPMLSDLRESGAIEQDADLVLFIFRPEVYDIDNYEDGKPTKGTAELILAKQRNGPIGISRAAFLTQYGIFENLMFIPELEFENNHLHVSTPGGSF